MLDRATGGIHCDDLSFAIDPGLTLTAFRGQSDASRFRPFIHNGEYVSYVASLSIGGEPFSVIVFFEAERLASVSLTSDEPGFPNSWAEVTQDDLDAVKARHDAWLEDQLGPPRLFAGHRFDWGEAGSNQDPRDGTASIRVSYPEPDERPAARPSS